MKYLLSAILLTILLTLTIKVEAKEDNGNSSSHYRVNLDGIVHSSDSVIHRIFKGGESQEQRDGRLAREREASRSTYRPVTSRTITGVSYAESSGGFGQATIIEKDTQYFNCVSFVKAMSGIYRPMGAGGRAAINSQEPRVGAVGVEARRVHATYITKIDGDNITILESNFYRGFITTRVLKRSDFLGFII